MKRRAWILALLLATLLAGCAGDLSGRGDALKRSLESYHRALKDREWESAAPLVSPSMRQAFLDEMQKKSAQREIQDWDIKPYTLPPRGEDVKLRVMRRSINTQTYEAREEQIEQVWRYMDRLWVLTGGSF